MSIYDMILQEEGANANRYDAVLEQEAKGRTQQLRQSLKSAAQSDPGQWAKSMDLSRKTGIPAPVVDRNQQEVESRASEADYQDIAQNYDRLAKWLTEDQNNARVAQDDLPALMQMHDLLRRGDERIDWLQPIPTTDQVTTSARIGRTLRPKSTDPTSDNEGLSWLFSAVPKAYRSGQSQVDLGMIGYAQLTGKATEDQLRRAEELEGQITGDNYGADGWWSNALMEASRQLPTLTGALSQGAVRGAQGAAAAGTAAAVVGQLGPQAALPEEIVTVPGAMIAGGGAGLKTGSVEFAFQLESGLAFREFQNFRDDEGTPLDEGAARVAAISAGAINAGLELVAFESFIKAFPGGEKLMGAGGRQVVRRALNIPTVRRAFSDLAVRYGEGVTTETLTEIAQEATTVIAGELAKAASDGEFDQISAREFYERMSEVAVRTLQASSILRAPGPAASFVHDALKARTAGQNQRYIAALGESAQASKLRERLPEKYQEAVGRLREGGEVENVYIPVQNWNEYFQSQGLQPSEVAREIFRGNKEYAEALAADSDLVIPIESYAAKIAGTPHHQGLSRDIRLRSGEMTAREAEQFQRDAPERIREYADQQEREAPVIESADRVEQAVFDQIKQTQQFTDDVARRYATLHRAFAESIASRTDMLPHEVYEKFGLQVEGELSGEATFRQADPPKSVEDLTKTAREEGIEVRASERDDVITLDKIEVPEADRDQGKGTQIMRSLIAYADATGKTIALTPSKDFGGDLKRLREFYKRLGFVENKGRSKDFSTQEAMVRAPETRELDQSAFHGTPHRFDRFSLDAIGTGEGAQAYGWGLYFAGEREVAEYYRNAIGGIQVKTPFGWRPFDPRKNLRSLGARTLIGRYPDDLPRIINDLRSRIRGRGTRYEQEIRDDIATLERINKRGVKAESGNVYQVNIPDDSELLNWDAPLDQQGEKTDALRRITDRIHGDGTFDTWTQAQDGGDFRDWKDNLMDDLGDRELSEALNAEGIPGLRYRDAASRSDTDAPTYNYVIWDEDVVTVEAVNDQLVQARELEQRRSDEDTRRGAIRLPADITKAPSVIALMEGADLSTFLHESGHFFLEVMGELAVDGLEQIQSDMQTVLDWMGVKDLETWRGMSINERRESHEKFARGFEAYLFEGKAPTAELQSLFARFRAWLVAVYRSLRALDVELTDEVRAVMDRLLATQEQIDAARERQNYQPMFNDQDFMSLTSAELSEYRKNVERARNEAEEELSTKVLNELRREERKWWKEAKEGVRAEVEAEINTQPVYQVKHFLRTGELLVGQMPEGVEPMKISKAALDQDYDKAFIKRLPVGSYRKEGGVHPDILAELFGFGSGDEMLKDIVAAESRRDVIEAETDRRMREKYGDIMEDGRLPEEAMKAVHSEQRANLLMTELRILGRRSKRRVSPQQTLKDAATRVIGDKPVWKIRPDVYRRAEAKAARASFQALADQNYELAFEHKQTQVFNHHLYREASKAREESEKIVDYMNRLGTKSSRERLGKAGQEYLDQIDDLLERFQFKRSVTLKAVRSRQSLREWVSEQQSKGLDVDVPEAVLNEAYRVHYRELPFEQLQGIRDTAKSIEHLSRLKNRLLSARDQREYEDTIADVVGSIEANHKLKDEVVDVAPGLKQRVGDFTQGLMAEHTKPEFLFEFLDGHKSMGPVWRALYKPINDASLEEQRMMADVVGKFQDIWSAYTRAERRAMHNKKFKSDALGINMTKGNLMSIALNWGNEGNREALLKGWGWTERQVETALDQLDKRDWDTVQAIWDLVNSLWPQIAQLQKDLTGIAPEKVEAAPVSTRHGTYRGGYYPLKYDSRFEFKAFRREEKEAQKDLFENNFIKPATKKGHTIERVGSDGQKVKIDLSVATDHLYQVIHDLTHRRAILDVDRIAQNSQVREAIEKTAGRQMYRQIRPWLQSIARDNWTPPSTIQDIMSRARAGATIVNMGWKVTTAVVQPLGYLQSIDLIGERYAWRGLQDFYKNPSKGWEFVMERSTMMQNRQKTFDRDIRDAGRRFQKEGNMTNVRESFFWMIGMFDMGVSMPTWLGAYKKAMEGQVDGVDSANEMAAIDYADQAVRMSQSAGDVKDLAGVQRHTEFMKLLTMFYSYFSVLYNLLQKRFGQVARGEMSKPRFVASMAYLWFLPAVLGELVAARPPEEDEDWWKWASTQGVLYPFGTVVFVRDVANAALTPYGFDLTPAADAPGKTAQALRAWLTKPFTDEEITRSDVKATVLAASYWGHLPGRQMWITGEYTYDLLTGEDEPENVGDFFRDMLFSRPATERN